MKISTIAVVTLLLLALPAAAGGEDVEGFVGSWPVSDDLPREATVLSQEPEVVTYSIDEHGEDAAAPTPWNFDLTLYLWLPSLDIEAILEGHDVDVDRSSSDSTSPSLHGAFTGRIEAWNHDFGIIFDLGMLSASEDLKVKGPGPVGVSRESEIELEGINAFLGVAWRFAGDPVGTYPHRSGFYGDLLGGARYNSLRLTVERQEGSDLEGDETYIEPVIGLRAGYNFGRVFTLSARAEAGGFGIADLPDYDVLILLEGRFHVTSWLDLDVGYQWKRLKLSTGSGNDEFGIKAAYAGPWLGITFLF